MIVLIGCAVCLYVGYQLGWEVGNGYGWLRRLKQEEDGE